MERRPALVAGLVGALAVTLCLGFSTATASAAAPGVVTASQRLVNKMVADMGVTNPAKCQAADLAQSDRDWAAFGLTSPLPSGCRPYDGFSVIHKVSGTWVAVPVGGSAVPCADFRKALAAQGAPTRVYADFRAAGYCMKG